MARASYLKALEALILVRIGVSGTRILTAALGILMGNCFRVWKAILKIAPILEGRPNATIFQSRWWAV
jgi:hypothetical protein